jgi:hypothetical protein
MTASIANESLSAHLNADQLHNIAFAATPVADADHDHLAACALCRAALADLALLRHELAVAQASQPSAAAQERYLALFAAAQNAATSPVAALTTWIAGFADAIKAALLWNGRARLAGQGIRNAAASSYRMLYSTPQAEIELLIEAVGGHFQVEGELLPAQAEGPLLPVLVELYQHSGTAGAHTPIFIGESDGEGRFHIPPMPAGAYALVLVPPAGETMLIDALELV